MKTSTFFLSVFLAIILSAPVASAQSKSAAGGDPRFSDCKKGEPDFQEMLTHFPPKEVNSWFLDEDGDCLACSESPPSYDPKTGYLIVDAGGVAIGKGLKEFGKSYARQVVDLFHLASSAVKTTLEVTSCATKDLFTLNRHEYTKKKLQGYKGQAKQNFFSVTSKEDFIQEIENFCQFSVLAVTDPKSHPIPDQALLRSRLTSCLRLGYPVEPGVISRFNQHADVKKYKLSLHPPKKARLGYQTLADRWYKFLPFTPELSEQEEDETIHLFDSLALNRTGRIIKDLGISTVSGFSCLPGPYRMILEGRVAGSLANIGTLFKVLKFAKNSKVLVAATEKLKNSKLVQKAGSIARVKSNEAALLGTEGKLKKTVDAIPSERKALRRAQKEIGDQPGEELKKIQTQTKHTQKSIEQLSQAKNRTAKQERRLRSLQDKVARLLEKEKTLVHQAAEKSAGRTLSVAEKEAIWQAHVVGEGAIGKNGKPAAKGNYTWAQIREKYSILADAGFDSKTIENFMVDGVVGAEGRESLSFFAKGQKVMVPRTTGPPTEAVVSHSEEPFLRMRLPDGKEMTVPYSNVEFDMDHARIFRPWALSDGRVQHFIDSGDGIITLSDGRKIQGIVTEFFPPGRKVKVTWDDGGGRYEKTLDANLVTPSGNSIRWIPAPAGNEAAYQQFRSAFDQGSFPGDAKYISYFDEFSDRRLPAEVLSKSGDGKFLEIRDLESGRTIRLGEKELQEVRLSATSKSVSARLLAEGSARLMAGDAAKIGLSERVLELRNQAKNVDNVSIARDPATQDFTNPAFLSMKASVEKSIDIFDRFLWSDKLQKRSFLLFKDDGLSKKDFRALYWKKMDEVHSSSNYQKGSDFYSKKPGVKRFGYAQSPPRIEAQKYTEAIAKEHNLGSLTDGKLEIEGIPLDERPSNILEAGIHFYPDSKHFRSYYDLAADYLYDLRKVLESGDNPAEARRLIGRYYHVMVNARPYDRINNSVFMNQANYLLKMTGHPGVPHGDLDHVLMRLTTKQADKVWPLILEGKIEKASQYGLKP